MKNVLLCLAIASTCAIYAATNEDYGSDWCVSVHFGDLPGIRVAVPWHEGMTVNEAKAIALEKLKENLDPMTRYVFAQIEGGKLHQCVEDEKVKSVTNGEFNAGLDRGKVYYLVSKLDRRLKKKA